MSERKPYVGGNWKMNTSNTEASDLIRGLCDSLTDMQGVDIAVFPPHPYLLPVGSIMKSRSSTIDLGTQDVYHEGNGAFTGEVSVAMAEDCGCTWVLTGHSERRHVMGEDDATVNTKARAVLDGGLGVVLCVGETLDQREGGETDAVNAHQVREGLKDVSAEQMSRVVIAYEPVWAIGTGKTASSDDAQAAHAKIRALLVELFDDEIAQRTRIIYGGSVKPGNAAELFAQPDIDGGLIGGASLKVGDFSSIVGAVPGLATSAGV